MSSYKKLINEIPLVLKRLDLNGNILDEGDLEINAFSITFPVVYGNLETKEEFYIKVPKFIFYNPEINIDTPLTQDDKALAKNEYSSLKILQEEWPSNSKVSFVEPVAFLEGHNAIITKRIEGEFFFKLLRNSYFSFFSSQTLSFNRASGVFRIFGSFLGMFHQSSSNNSEFNMSKYLSEIKNYLSILGEEGLEENYLNELGSKINSVRLESKEVNQVNCLKGIDIRQFFLLENGEIKIIDPGKLFISYAETDLARFIVTCRLLYWGTLQVLLGKTINNSLEGDFLNFYSEQNPFSKDILSLLIIKELLKQWIVILESLHFRKWNKIFKFVYKKYYLNSFFKRLLLDEINRPKSI